MFNKEVRVVVKDFTNNEYAHNPEEGEKIAKYIEEKYKGDSNLIIDFDGIKSINTAFANKVIYGLYKNFEPEILNKFFKLRNYNELIQETIKRVIENYKEGKDDLQ